MWREWWNLRECILIFSSIASAPAPPPSPLHLCLPPSLPPSMFCVVCLSASRHDLSPLLCHSTGTVSSSAALRMCTHKEEQAPALSSLSTTTITQRQHCKHHHQHCRLIIHPPIHSGCMHWSEAVGDKESTSF
jgi:hypothetical protein